MAPAKPCFADFAGAITEVEPGTGGMLPLPGAREAPGAPPAASGCYASCPAALLSGELTRGASGNPVADRSWDLANPAQLASSGSLAGSLPYTGQGILGSASSGSLTGGLPCPGQGRAGSASATGRQRSSAGKAGRRPRTVMYYRLRGQEEVRCRLLTKVEGKYFKRT